MVNLMALTILSEVSRRLYLRRLGVVICNYLSVRSRSSLQASVTRISSE